MHEHQCTETETRHASKHVTFYPPTPTKKTCEQTAFQTFSLQSHSIKIPFCSKLDKADFCIIYYTHTF